MNSRKSIIIGVSVLAIAVASVYAWKSAQSSPTADTPAKPIFEDVSTGTGITSSGQKTSESFLSGSGISTRTGAINPPARRVSSGSVTASGETAEQKALEDKEVEKTMNEIDQLFDGISDETGSAKSTSKK